MANKAISELPQAQNVNNQDLFVLEQSGIAKKLPAETFITEQGIIDALAEALDGHGGIQSVTLSSVSGRIRTYRITFTDQSATTFQVYDGTSIDRISRTSSSGLDDVYTIFLSDGTTTFFTVHNGADGTVSEAMLNDALKDKAPAITETTESSAIANFPDGADDLVMHNIVAEINPVQSGSGDPAPDNIRPISGWTGCNVARTGKNLFDKTTQAKNWYATSSNTIGNGGTLCLFSVPVGTTITVSGTNGSRNRLLYTDKDISDIAVGAQLTFLSNTNLPFTITTDHKTYAYYIETSFNQALVDSIQLELGSSATDYEAYQGTTVTVDWTTEAGTVYGGTIDVATGLLTVTHGYTTFNGSEVWQSAGARQGFYTKLDTLRKTLNYSNSIICDKLQSCINNFNDPFISIGYGICGYADSNNSYPNQNWIYAKGGGATSSAEFKTWLQSNPIQVVYELATPQTYQLTPQEVKTLLGTNNVWTDIGNVSVTYPADTKMFIEKLTMPTEDDLVANQAITSGKYFMVGNSLYLALANIASGAQITIGTNAQRVSLADALNTINS